MTKKEIREKHLHKNGLSVNKSPIGLSIQKAAFDAMDEWAQQEMEKAFNAARLFDKKDTQFKYKTFKGYKKSQQ